MSEDDTIEVGRIRNSEIFFIAFPQVDTKTTHPNHCRRPVVEGYLSVEDARRVAKELLRLVRQFDQAGD